MILFFFRACLVVSKYAQKVFLGDPPASESDLWNLNKFPTRDFALAIYPQFAKMKSFAKSTNGNGLGSDVVIFFQDSRLFVQAIRKLKDGQVVDIHWDGEMKKEQVLHDMINFKCAGKNCELSFPLQEKTSEQIIKCPLEKCASETNIWKRKKRIVELKRDHETARKELESKKIRSAIHFLIDIIAEWDTMIYRPYKEVTKLEDDLKKAILLNNETMEREWMHSVK